MKRVSKLHYQDKTFSLPRSICGQEEGKTGFGLKTTLGPQVVTCHNCLRLLNKRTTEQGGGPKKFTVMVNAVGKNPIAVVRAIREASSSGLKESKELMDNVRYNNQPTIILDTTDENLALHAMVLVSQAGASGVFYKGSSPTDFFPTDSPKSVQRWGHRDLENKSNGLLDDLTNAVIILMNSPEDNTRDTVRLTLKDFLEKRNLL